LNIHPWLVFTELLATFLPPIIREGVPYLNSNEDFSSQPFVGKALLTYK